MSAPATNKYIHEVLWLIKAEIRQKKITKRQTQLSSAEKSKRGPSRRLERLLKASWKVQVEEAACRDFCFICDPGPINWPPHSLTRFRTAVEIPQPLTHTHRHVFKLQRQEMGIPRNFSLPLLLSFQDSEAPCQGGKKLNNHLTICLSRPKSLLNFTWPDKIRLYFEAFHFQLTII